eukprot:5142677-Pleurochrysis_carterae.AAC.1
MKFTTALFRSYPARWTPFARHALSPRASPFSPRGWRHCRLCQWRALRPAYLLRGLRPNHDRVLLED